MFQIFHHSTLPSYTCAKSMNSIKIEPRDRVNHNECWLGYWAIYPRRRWSNVNGCTVNQAAEPSQNQSRSTANSKWIGTNLCDRGGNCHSGGDWDGTGDGNRVGNNIGYGHGAGLNRKCRCRCNRRRLRCESCRYGHCSGSNSHRASRDRDSGCATGLTVDGSRRGRYNRTNLRHATNVIEDIGTAKVWDKVIGHRRSVQQAIPLTVGEGVAATLRRTQGSACSLIGLWDEIICVGAVLIVSCDTACCSPTLDGRLCTGERKQRY